MSDLQPIRDLCIVNPDAQLWLQDCFTELINEAIKAKHYAAVDSINYLLQLLLPHPSAEKDPELRAIDVTVVEPQAPALPQLSAVESWTTPEGEAILRQEILDLLAAWRVDKGMTYLGSAKIIDAIEAPYIQRGEWRKLPAVVPEGDKNHARLSKPWRGRLGAILYALVDEGLLDNVNRSYRLRRKALVTR